MTSTTHPIHSETKELHVALIEQRAALVELRAWIGHWQSDAEFGMLPTQSSLAYARAVADRAIGKGSQS